MGILTDANDLRAAVVVVGERPHVLLPVVGVVQMCVEGSLAVNAGQLKMLTA